MFIGIFALIVVTTATLQKFIWEYKYTYAKGYIRKHRRQLRDFMNMLEK